MLPLFYATAAAATTHRKYPSISKSWRCQTSKVRYTVATNGQWRLNPWSAKKTSHTGRLMMCDEKRCAMACRLAFACPQKPYLRWRYHEYRILCHFDSFDSFPHGLVLFRRQYLYYLYNCKFEFPFDNDRTARIE